MSLGEVAAQIERVCALSDQARRALVQADELLDDATALLAATLAGSNDSEWEQVRAHLTEASRRIRELLGNLNTAERDARAYLDNAIGPVSSPAATAEQPPTQRHTAPAPASDPPVIPAERLDALRRELPPPIKDTDSGRKTHGRWIGPDGEARSIISGVDDDSRAADELLHRLGVPRKPARTADVEMKLAARMVRDHIRHATVLINNVPCKGRLSCDTLVPIMLPEGATLTVHGVTEQGALFRKRYTGGARPWWR